MTNKRAFTLTELLIVIGITVVLFAVAVPNLTAESKSLSITELDNIARNIYISSQSKLLEAKSMGTLENINTVAKAAEVGKSIPTGRPTGLCSISKTDAENSGIIMEGILDSEVNAGDFVIEYHPESASVYGVFYSDETFIYKDETAFNTRSKTDRLNHTPMIGYYGDGTIITAPEQLIKLDKPTITIVNEEELYATITTTQSNLPGKNLKLIISLVTDSGEFVIKTESLHNEANTYIIYLDTYKTSHGSSTSSNQFKDWISGTTIKSGDNVKLKVELVYEGFDKKTSPSQLISREFNSLFANKSGDTVDISYGRHLQNLDKDTSDNEDIDIVNQVADIDFGVGSKWYTTYGTKEFTSIEAEFEEYQGNNKKIENIKITATDSCGIFEKLEDVTIKDLEIIDPIVILTVDEDDSIGILAGEISDTTVSNVRIFAKDATTANNIDFKIKNKTGHNEKIDIGGFVGTSTDSTISNCSLSLAKMTVNYKKATVGTFIGSMEGTTISNCYSSVDNLTANGNGGFFVGNSKRNSDTIKNCYTVGNLDVGNAVGKFTSFTKSTSQGATITNSYAAVTYYDGAGKVVIPDSNKADAFSLKCKANNSNFYLDMGEVGDNGNKLQTSSMALPASYDNLRTDYKEPPLPSDKHFDGVKANSSLSIPYRVITSGEMPSVYPFEVHRRFVGANIPNHHYGSWPKEVVTSVINYKDAYGIAYWETYESDSGYGYGVYAQIHDVKTGKLLKPLDTLKNGPDDKVSDWGYGVIVPEYIMGVDSGHSGTAWNIKVGGYSSDALVVDGVADWGTIATNSVLPDDLVLKIPNNPTDPANIKHGTLEQMYQNSLQIYIGLDVKPYREDHTRKEIVYYQINPKFGKSVEYVLKTDNNGNITEVAQPENLEHIAKHLSGGVRDSIFEIVKIDYNPTGEIIYQQAKLGETIDNPFYIRHPDHLTNSLNLVEYAGKIFKKSSNMAK